MIKKRALKPSLVQGLKKPEIKNRSGCYDLIRILKAVPFDGLFPHLVLEDLARSIHRESFNEVNVSRNLMLSHMIHDILLDLFFR